LSLIVEKTDDKYSKVEGNLCEFCIYNFDLETGKLLSNREFIKRCGYSIKEFEGKAGFNIDDINITFDDRINMFKGDKHDFKDEVDDIDKFYVFKNSDKYNWIEVNMK
jgi:hypothetical protein